MASPGSAHRGLIDDEIRDQPELLSLASRSPAEEEEEEARSQRPHIPQSASLDAASLTARFALLSLAFLAHVMEWIALQPPVHQRRGGLRSQRVQPDSVGLSSESDQGGGIS